MHIENFCLIIGTQKGGTTSLFAYLSQHPEVCASRIKETNFFLEDSQWEKGISDYTALWNTLGAGHKVALEASPNYTNSLREADLVVQRVKAIDANFRFIYILRDPLEKISSMRKQGIYQGWYSKLLERETPESVPPETMEPARYAEIVDKFVEAFSKERVLLLQMSDLRPSSGRPAAAMARICEFLSIDSTFEFELDKIHNAQNSYREDTFWHMLRASDFLSPIKGIFPDTIKNKARSLLSKPLAASIEGRETQAPPLTEAQKAFILRALSDEFRRLEQDYGLDLSRWSRLSNGLS